MVVTLEDTKKWLRIDVDTENALIEAMIETAEDIVEGILRVILLVSYLSRSRPPYIMRFQNFMKREMN